MKRFILLPLLPLFILSTLQAQTLNYGVKAGKSPVQFTDLYDAAGQAA